MLRRSALIFVHLFFYAVNSGAEDGICWQTGKGNDLCGRLLRRGITKEKCCIGGKNRSFSTSTLQFASTSIFYLSGKNICKSCAGSCHNITCEEDEECIVKRGMPKCVCSPKCHLQKEEKICGSDGRTYRSECHLLKRACRKNKKIRIAHTGACQSCHGMRCHENRVCVVDEHMIPHCIKSPKNCSKRRVKRQICGVDGVTYQSRCALKVESCKKGRMIAKAYKGRCKKRASCNNVRCWTGEKCLTRVDNKGPHCSYCEDVKYCKNSNQPVCTSDGRIFQSRCAFKHESCRSGKALIAVPLHFCTLGKLYIKANKCEISDFIGRQKLSIDKNAIRSINNQRSRKRKKSMRKRDKKRK